MPLNKETKPNHDEKLEIPDFEKKLTLLKKIVRISLFMDSTD